MTEGLKWRRIGSPNKCVGLAKPFIYRLACFKPEASPSQFNLVHLHEHHVAADKRILLEDCRWQLGKFVIPVVNITRSQAARKLPLEALMSINFNIYYVVKMNWFVDGWLACLIMA